MIRNVFHAQLAAAAAAHDSWVCVGLDPEIERFPPQLRDRPDAILAFNRAIIDATADLVCAYKPQIAHYAAVGAEDQLLDTLRYIRERAPGVPVILDSKRGDIGSTAEKYAREAFERAQHAVDAARPEVERLARDAAAAAQSAAAFARPVVERVAHDAVDYARDHQDELRRAATSAADAAANLATQRIVPGPLRPMVDALRQELQNDEPPADAVPREPESPTAETHLDDGAAQPPPAAQR